MEKPINFPGPYQGKIAKYYFTIFLSGLNLIALKRFESVGKWWGILEWGLVHVITSSISEMMNELISTKLHSQKKRDATFQLS